VLAVDSAAVVNLDSEWGMRVVMGLGVLVILLANAGLVYGAVELARFP
jgi:hypothetical protein